MRLGFSYREQIAAWNEIHSTFARNFDVKGPSPFAAFSEAHQEGSALFPVIWDLDVDEDRVYVLWVQGGDDFYTLDYSYGIVYKYRMYPL
jgi:hypothetical protein